MNLEWLEKDSVLGVIGRRLRFTRRQLNLSLQDVAAAIEISYTSLSLYERGKVRIPSDLLYRLAVHYNAPICQFYPSHPEPSKTQRPTSLSTPVSPCSARLGLPSPPVSAAPSRPSVSIGKPQ
ncbi:MAG: hypothetical protein CML16_00325 [Pusillimonas sp.]|nr:hypothetical protein [Pusillimonas sp.]